MDVNNILSNTKEKAAASGTTNAKKRSRITISIKRKGMNRELSQLLGNNNNQIQDLPLMPSRKLILSKYPSRKWKNKKIKNSARDSLGYKSLSISHWERVEPDEEEEEEEGRDYRFAKFNVDCKTFKYTDEEYELHLKSSDWSKEETDILFDLIDLYGLRFPVIIDYWRGLVEKEKEKGGDFIKERSIEDLKERYYNISPVLKNPYNVDSEKNRRRIYELMYLRSKGQVRREKGAVSSQGGHYHIVPKIDTSGGVTIDSVMSSNNNNNKKNNSTIYSYCFYFRPETNEDLVVKINNNNDNNLNNNNIVDGGGGSRTVLALIPLAVDEEGARYVDGKMESFGIGRIPLPNKECCDAFAQLRREVLRLATENVGLSVLKAEKEVLSSRLFYLKGLERKREERKKKEKTLAIRPF